MADISNNYSVTLQATIAKITQAELDKAVAGLKLKIKTELDTTGVQNQVNNAITKAATSGKGKSIIPTQPTIDALGVIQNRINEIKKSGGTTPDTAIFKNSANEINKATLDYADALGIAKTETFSLVDANGKVTKNMSDAVGFTRQLTKETTKVSDVNNNLANTLASNAKKVAEWAISTALIYGTIHEIRKAMEYISELNKEMTSIQMVTGMSPSDVNKLSNDYNKLAAELGSTTLEISKGSLEWFRQGKTVEEVSELMRSTMMMSKLGNIDSAQSTEYLTSTLNGFKLEAKDAISVVDKLTALDNNYATSVAEIASALQRSSNSAQQAGVTFDELASYITVVSSVTRKSAESIGESFKTMFARMENIKLGKMFEDDPTTLNDVEKALGLVNIKLRDAKDSFRPLGDVMDEVAAKWSTMNEIEQSAVANAIAGVRQRENFIALMSNYNEVLKAQSIAADSAGLANERFAIYLESVEASANRAKTAWEGMWQATIESGAIKFFYDASAAVANLITKLGGLVPVLEAILVIVSAIKAEMIYTSATSLIGKIPLLLTQLKNLGAGLLSLLPFFKGLRVEAYSMSQAVGISMAAIVAWIEVFRTYKKEILDENTAGISGVSGAFSAQLSSKKTTSEVLSANQSALSFAEKNIKEGGIGKGMVQEQKLNNEILNQTIKKLSQVTGSYEEYQKAVSDATSAAKGMSYENGKIYENVDGHRRFADGVKVLTEAEYEAAKATQLTAEAEAQATQEQESRLQSVISLTSDLGILSEAMKEQNDQGYISYDTAIKLISANADLAQYLTQTANGYLFDAEAARQDAYAAMYNAFHKYGIASAAVAAANGNYKYAMSAIASAKATDEEKKAMIGLLNAFAAMSITVGGTGGSGGGSSLNKVNEEAIKLKEQEVDAINDNIDALNKEKDALQDRLKAYKKIIDAQKEKLRLDKEEKDYQKDLKEKNDELVDIDNELLALQFDNSQEANARRLELEDAKAKKIAEISEFQADRTYDIQIEALDREYEAYKAFIDAQIANLDRLIDGFRTMIEVIQEAIAALREMNSESGGGGGGGGGSTIVPYVPTNDMAEDNGEPFDDRLIPDNMAKQIVKPRRWGGEQWHTGGLVESHHNGEFAGGLKSNEVFAKLLKGEYIATEGQMQNFMNRTLPELAGRSQGNSIGDINLTIDVAGNMDKSVIPDIKQAVFEVMNQAIRARGKKTNAFYSSI